MISTKLAYVMIQAMQKLSFFKQLAPIFCIAAFSIGLTYATPNYQRVSSGYTSQKEQELGQQFARMIQKNLPILSDPIVNDYIQNIGFRLISYSAKPSKHYQFFVVRDSGINAFTGPDGYVGINAGLILKVQTESELAAVMSHEISHATQEHLMQSLEKQKKLQIINIAAILAAAVIATQNPNAGMGALTSVSAGSYQYFFNYSRVYEKEADRTGIQLLSNAGFNAKGMPDMLKLMLKEDRLNDLGFSKYLRTHPITAERLTDVQNRVALMKNNHYKDTQEFSLIQARLLVDAKQNKPHELMRTFEKQKQSVKNRYAYTLAANVAGNYKAAEKTINKLIKQYPNQIIFKLTLANIQAKSKQLSQAQQTYETLYKYNSDYYPLLLQYGYFLLTEDKANQAMKMLEKHESEYENDIRYLALLSRAQGKSKQLVKAYQTRAQIYILAGNKKAAVQQLKLALQFAKSDAYTTSLIKAKMKEISKT